MAREVCRVPCPGKGAEWKNNPKEWLEAVSPAELASPRGSEGRAGAGWGGLSRGCDVGGGGCA